MESKRKPATLLEAWQRQAEQRPDKAAIRDSHGAALTYAEADRQARILASHFRGLDVGPGSIIACQLPGWVEFLPIYIAALKLGAIFNPIPPNLRTYDLSRMLCSSQILIVPRSYRNFTYCGMADDLTERHPHLRAQIAVDKFSEGSRLPTYAQIVAEGQEAPLPPSRRGPDDPAAILFTSGSEGRPKGVVFSHRNILAAEGSFMEFFGLGENDRMFMPAPLAHAIGFHHGVSMSFISGGTCILQDKFVPEEALALMEAHKATVSMATTAFLHDLLKVLRQREFDLSSLRFFLSGGSAPNYALVAEARERGINVLNVYGSSESVPHMGTPPGATAEQKARQALFPMPGVEVRLVDEAGHEAAPGQEGEELSRGDAVFLGYLTRGGGVESALEDGWHRSGDLCRRLPDGSYAVTGRKKDIIIRGGENISSPEVEGILLKHGKVAEACVVAMPDPRLQERVCAYVVLKDPGQSLDVQELRNHFAELKVAALKCPEHIEIVPELPRTESGKVDKVLLAKKIAAKAPLKG